MHYYKITENMHYYKITETKALAAYGGIAYSTSTTDWHLKIDGDEYTALSFKSVYYW